MKKFFVYLGTLLLLVFTLSFGAAALLDRIYQVVRTGQTGGKINDYLLRAAEPDMVIMGDSRALYQVIPDSFGLPTYSLCHAGMSQAFQTGLYSLISQQRNPKVVLLQIAPYEYTASSEANNTVQNLKYYYGRHDTITRYINRISRYEPYKYWLDLYRYNGRVIPLLKNLVETYRHSDYGNGYVPMPPMPRDSLNTVLSARADSNSRVQRFHYPRLRYLRSFVDLCKQHNTKLICFTSPVYRQSDYALRGTAVLDSFLTASGVPYVDYIRHPLPQLQRRGVYWKDGRHLNELGGAIQSRHLAGEVQRLLAPPTATPAVSTATTNQATGQN